MYTNIRDAVNIRDVAMYSTLRCDDVAMPRWSTVLGHARRPLAPVLGFRPRNFYRTAASEWGRLLNNVLHMAPSRSIYIIAQAGLDIVVPGQQPRANRVAPIERLLFPQVVIDRIGILAERVRSQQRVDCSLVRHVCSGAPARVDSRDRSGVSVRSLEPG